ncbi:MAG: response regulator [Bacteroidales bacterium]
MQLDRINKEYKILLVDDHPLMLIGAQSLLGQNPLYNITALENPLSAITISNAKSYDLLITDLEMPDVSGYELIEGLRKINPKLLVIVHTFHDEVMVLKKLIDLKVNGIVVKSARLNAIIQAVELVLDGDTYYDSAIRSTIKELVVLDGKDNLSVKELEVLRAICQGETTKEIAQRTSKSVNTIETHRKNIFSKLDVKNTAQLIMKAIQLGIIGKLSD